MNDIPKPWWTTIKWNGMKAAPRQPRRMAAEPFSPAIPFTWVPWAIPAESQNGPSCAGHGMANFKEIMLRRFADPKAFKVWQQLDGDAIWKRAREMFYAGDMDGGLYVPEAFDAALDMGIFAPGSTLRTVSRSESFHSDQFLLTPYIDGHDVSGWVNRECNPDNGQVYEGAGSEGDGTGGHCRVRVSQMTQDGVNYCQLLNSWGVHHGWNGIDLQTENEDDLTGLEEKVYFVREPDGWEKWDGWRKWVIG